MGILPQTIQAMLAPKPKPEPEPKPEPRRDDQPAGQFCDSCHYFYEFHKGEAAESAADWGSGWCRRYPPIYSDRLSHSRYPEVEFSDWCGEWKPSKEQAKCESIAESVIR